MIGRIKQGLRWTGNLLKTTVLLAFAAIFLPALANMDLRYSMEETGWYGLVLFAILSIWYGHAKSVDDQTRGQRDWVSWLNLLGQALIWGSLLWVGFGYRTLPLPLMALLALASLVTLGVVIARCLMPDGFSRAKQGAEKKKDDTDKQAVHHSDEKSGSRGTGHMLLTKLNIAIIAINLVLVLVVPWGAAAAEVWCGMLMRWHMTLTILGLLTATLIYGAVSCGGWGGRLRKRIGWDEGKIPECTYSERWSVTIVTIGVFISIAVMLFGYTSQEDYNVSPVAAALDAAVRSGQAFSLEFSIPGMWELLENVHMPRAPIGDAIKATPGLSLGDSLWFAVLLTMAPVMTVGTFASFFRTPRLWFSLMRCIFSKKQMCIFSDLNERAMKYATALRSTSRDGTPYIIFCSDGQVNTVDTAGLTGDSLVLERSISSLRLPASAMKHISFYLVTDDENAVIEMADKLQDKYCDKHCFIYCISSGRLNEHAVDQMNREIRSKLSSRQTGKNKDKQKSSEELKDNKPQTISFSAQGTLLEDNEIRVSALRTAYVDIINEACRVVYYDMYHRPVIKPAMLKCISDDLEKNKTLRVLVLGAGAVGEELARNMLWYGQMPGVGVRVTVAGKESEKEIRSRVYRKNLNFEQLLRSIGYEDLARLNVRGGVDLLTEDLEDILRESTFHIIYVATGDDNQNYHLSLRVRRHYLRHPETWGYPTIRTVVWNDVMTSIIDTKDYVALKGSKSSKESKESESKESESKESESKERITDYSLLMKEKAGQNDQEQQGNERCQVELMGSMSETINMSHAMEFDALRYHAFYWGCERRNISGAGDRKICIPEHVYTKYYESSESDERSNWAVAVHSRVKENWREYINQKYGATERSEERKHQISLMLAENEHVRWCIYKLLEGDTPLLDENGKLNDSLTEKYLDGNPSGRDSDMIRGIHVVLRPWEDIVRFAYRNIFDMPAKQEKLGLKLPLLPENKATHAYMQETCRRVVKDKKWKEKINEDENKAKDENKEKDVFWLARFDSNWRFAEFQQEMKAAADDADEQEGGAA